MLERLFGWLQRRSCMHSWQTDRLTGAQRCRWCDTLRGDR